MATQQDRPQLPKVRFRVLIIGRANAGKTSILKRVCETTESPEIYRLGPSGTRERVQLDPTTERGLHEIDDELTFTNHDGYVFHDSRGLEAGGEAELKIVQDFVLRKSRERRLNDRLHAIWYCVPMDGNRPSLDIKDFSNICPDKNVPVIAVFTKFDQFKRNIRMELGANRETDINPDVEAAFDQRYLNEFTKRPSFVRLEKMHKQGQCADLIDKTANELGDDVVTLMLVAVQKDNLELSVKQAITRTHTKLKQGIVSIEVVVRVCIVAFPSLWLARALQMGDLRVQNFDFDLEMMFFANKEFLEKDDDGSADVVKTLLSKSRSFITHPSINVSSDNTHHAMIVTVLILECASLLFASSSSPTLHESLDKACSRYISSDIHIAVKQQFLLSPNDYSIPEFTEFVLKNRLR